MVQERKLPVEIVKIRPEDIPACGIVMDAAYGGGGLTERLIHNRKFQPENWFMARDTSQDDQIVGAAGAMNYGPFASIGMVAVHPDHQRRGIGTAIMAHLLDVLETQGCPVSILDATTMGAPIYAKLGFIEEGRTYRFSHLNHTPTRAPLPAGVRRARPEELGDIIAWDARYFGATRPQIYHDQEERTPGRIFVAHDPRGSISGVLCVQDTLIGPWVAADVESAEKLLQAALTLDYLEEPRVIFPAANPETVPLLRRYGFEQVRDIRHMRRGGERDPREIAHYYAQTSFMLG
jgi:GNAT superfamily N-acetyltransferase